VHPQLILFYSVYDKNESYLIQVIKECLDDKLRNKRYRGHLNKFTGHCYVASEAFYHLTKQTGLYVPSYVKFEGDTHWFLTKKDGNIIDITAEQFNGKIPPYNLKKNCGFLTKAPSKRTAKLLQKIEQNYNVKILL
jgi:hypothetical protein